MNRNGFDGERLRGTDAGAGDEAPRKRRRRPFTKDEREALRLLHQGYNLTDVCDLLSVNRSILARWRHGYEGYAAGEADARDLYCAQVADGLDELLRKTNAFLDYTMSNQDAPFGQRIRVASLVYRHMRAGNMNAAPLQALMAPCELKKDGFWYLEEQEAGEPPEEPMVAEEETREPAGQETGAEDVACEGGEELLTAEEAEPEDGLLEVPVTGYPERARRRQEGTRLDGGGGGSGGEPSVGGTPGDERKKPGREEAAMEDGEVAGRPAERKERRG